MTPMGFGDRLKKLTLLGYKLLKLEIKGVQKYIHPQMNISTQPGFRLRLHRMSANRVSPGFVISPDRHFIIRRSNYGQKFAGEDSPLTEGNSVQSRTAYTQVKDRDGCIL